jgi:DNA-binding NarL/FixJ family response regulator
VTESVRVSAMNPISYIVLLDDDRADSSNIKKSMDALFKDASLNVLIENLTNPKDLPKALLKHPDIVICDVSLDGRDDIKGLELIENYKKKFPHISFAAMTSNYEQLAKIDQIDIAPEFMLPKNLLLPEVDTKFGPSLVARVLQSTRQNRAFTISMQTAVEASIKAGFDWQKFDRDLVECLIRQVFSTSAVPTNTAVDFEMVSDGKIRLPPPIIDRVDIANFDDPPSSRSGSVICMALPKAFDHVNEVSVVLKFCRIEAFFAELRNFVRYVKWTLPSAWRVEILGTGRVGRFGVIGYSLAFAGSDKAYPLSHFLKAGEEKPVKWFIENVFNESRKVWYKNPNNEEGLNKRLTGRYFAGDGQTRNSAVDGAVTAVRKTKVYKAWECADHDKPLALKRAVNRILTNPWSSFQTCICHGDLHAGNIMSAQTTPGMVFIDFQDTGHHHVFTDFIFFENAIRKDGGFAYPAEPASIVQAEKSEIAALLKGEEASLGAQSWNALSLIREVRMRAFRNFPEEPREHYFVHALIFLLLMFRMADVAPEAKERLAAFFIACCEELELRVGVAINAE